VVVRDLVGCCEARQVGGAVLTGSLRLHRFLLERDHLARCEGGAWDVGPPMDLDKLAAVDAVLEVPLDLTAAKEKAPIPRVNASRSSARSGYRQRGASLAGPQR
jgi:hypothetical protein